MEKDAYNGSLKVLCRKIIAKYPYLSVDNNILNDFLKQKRVRYSSDPSDKIERFIKDYIKNVLKSDNYLELINRYIDFKVKKNKKINIVDLLGSLYNFFMEYQFDLTPQTIEIIIKNNAFLTSNMEKFINNNLEELKSGNLKNAFANEGVILFVETYCAFNGIDLEEKFDLDCYEEDSKSDDIYYNPDTLKSLVYQIKQYELLSELEVNELISQYRYGNLEARNKVVNHNLRLVLYVARKNANRGVDILDLFQEGTTGLMRAIESFDSSYGCKFANYAIFWIRQTINICIQNTSRTIRVPAYIHEKFAEYLQTRNRLELQKMRKVSNEEIADEMKVSLDELEKLIRYYNSEPISLDAKMSNEDDKDAEFGAFVSSTDLSLEDEFIERDMPHQIIKLLKKANLDARQIDILIRRNGLITGEVETLEKIGNSYGLKRERIRQIENKALLILRRSSVRNVLADYAQNPDKCLSDVKEMADGRNNAEQYGINGVKKEKVFVKNMTIYEYLKGFDKYSIDRLIKKLSPTSREILRMRFGDDLNKSSECVCLEYNVNYKVNILLKYMKSILKNPKYQPRNKSLYSYFKADCLVVDLAISYLSKDEMNLLFLKYGKDFYNPSHSIDWDYEPSNEQEFMKIVDKINSFVVEFHKPFVESKAKVRPILRSFYDLFLEFAKNEIDMVLANLSNRDLRILKVKFGENLDSKVLQCDLSQRDLARYYQIIKNIRKALESHKYAKTSIDGKFTSKELVSNNFSNYDKENIKNLLSNLPEGLELSELEIILLNMKFGKPTNSYSLEKLANIFNVSETEIINITKLAILKLKDYLMNNLKSEMASIELDMEKDIHLTRTK